MNPGGILYAPRTNSISNRKMNSIYEDFGFFRLLSENFLFMKFKELGIYVKTKHSSGKKFKYTATHIIAAIQKEMFMHTIDSLSKPKICLNIGGPSGEWCKRSISIDIAGKPNIRARGEVLPIADNSIDLVYSCHSLEHMEDTRKTLREWVRVLRKNGLLVVIVPVLPYHMHGKTKALGQRCYEEHTTEEFRDIFEGIDDTTILQFNIKQNKFDIEIILRKDE